MYVICIGRRNINRMDGVVRETANAGIIMCGA